MAQAALEASMKIQQQAADQARRTMADAQAQIQDTKDALKKIEEAAPGTTRLTRG
ncbi:MAG TPA: hypothetical protein VMU31_06965 [Rhizomicrobium sp.]|nr:hypothetical protein [Rhizomicrobium sp.]